MGGVPTRLFQNNPPSHYFGLFLDEFMQGLEFSCPATYLLAVDFLCTGISFRCSLPPTILVLCLPSCIVNGVFPPLQSLALIFFAKTNVWSPPEPL